MLSPLLQNERIAEFVRSPWEWLVLWLIVANLAAFALFGLDKWKAKRKARRPGVWRIREKTLLLWALAGGSVGGLLGMRVFRHKTRKPRFAVGLPLILVLHLLIALSAYLRFFL